MLTIIAIILKKSHVNLAGLDGCKIGILSKRISHFLTNNLVVRENEF